MESLELMVTHLLFKRAAAGPALRAYPKTGGSGSHARPSAVEPPVPGFRIGSKSGGLYRRAFNSSLIGPEAWRDSNMVSPFWQTLGAVFRKVPRWIDTTIEPLYNEKAT